MKSSEYMPLASQSMLFYIETLSRVDIIPSRDLYDFYGKSRCKGEIVENGVNDVNNSENEETRANGVAPMKPLSPPPVPYTLSN